MQKKYLGYININVLRKLKLWRTWKNDVSHQKYILTIFNTFSHKMYLIYIFIAKILLVRNCYKLLYILSALLTIIKFYFFFQKFITYLLMSIVIKIIFRKF